MKVQVKYSDKVMDLEDALTPFPYISGMGRVESAAEQADAALKCIGRILATLVNKKLLTLNEAASISNSEDLIEVPEREFIGKKK